MHLLTYYQYFFFLKSLFLADIYSFTCPQIGLLTGVGLSILLYLCFGTFVELFTTDSSVLEIVRSGVLV